MKSEQHSVNQRSLLGIFTKHPASVGESYLQHFSFALRFSGRLFMAGVAALVHAFVPALCEKTASTQIARMYQDLNTRL